MFSFVPVVLTPLGLTLFCISRCNVLCVAALFAGDLVGLQTCVKNALASPVSISLVTTSSLAELWSLTFGMLYLIHLLLVSTDSTML